MTVQGKNLKDLADKLFEDGAIDEEERKAAYLGDEAELAEKIKKESAEEGDIRTLIRDMTLPQKMKAAMFGNATCRMLLIMDKNRLIQEAVLKNPQMQEREVVEFAKNKNMPELVLRKISDAKDWMKGYPIKLNLVMNPKTPVDVGLKWLKFLRNNDLKQVSNSKNVPQVIATMAKKIVADKQKR